MGGEIDSFFTKISYWLKYYERAYETINRLGMQSPPEKILDEPEEFRNWVDRMVEVKRNENK